ncbi:hypothetical protein CALCODRAFT_489154 [Calocera cornea HHB12733]|uniref:Uncharacterized protein n=1 Tax=Calocera cornea HHB12733 TaxID=1353952 RepID=A0A166JGD3_9BASI|nr:hypothetical protein CALCODRAFT_489154 [Calocera cornea HHB12733]
MRESEAAARKALSLAPAAANAPQPPTTTLERTVGAGRTRVDTPSSTLDVHRPAGSTERPQESKVADVGAQTPARVAGAAVLGGGTGMLSPPPTDRRLTGGSASRQSGTPAASDNGTSVAGKRTREQSGFVGEENQESTSKKKKRTPGNGPSPAMVHVQ